MLFALPHAGPLIEARFLRRRNRFLADLELSGGPRAGEEIVAHCVNPGRMEGMLQPRARSWVIPAPEGSKRKLAWTWELVELIEDGEAQLVGANTVRPNAIVGEALRARALPGLKRWRQLVPERRYGGESRSRVDFFIEDAQGEHFVEVKNCHLVYPDRRGYFPDSVTARGTRHLEELAELAAAGTRASVLFTVQRGDARAIRPSDVHDPAFAAAARHAAEQGVRFRAFRVRPTLEAYEIEREIPVDLRPYALENPERWRADRREHSGWIQTRRGQSHHSGK